MAGPRELPYRSFEVYNGGCDLAGSMSARDVGWAPGYTHLLAVLANPSHPEHQTYVARVNSGNGSLGSAPKRSTSDRAVRGKMVTARASMGSCATSCSTAKSSTHCGKRK